MSKPTTKLNVEAKSWTPNPSANAFVPGAASVPAAGTTTTAPAANLQKNNANPGNQHPRMNTSAPSWNPIAVHGFNNTAPSYVPSYNNGYPVYHQQMPMYNGGEYGQVYPQHHFPNHMMPAPAYGGNDKPNFQHNGHKNNNHNNKKGHHNNHNHSNGNHNNTGNTSSAPVVDKSNTVAKSKVVEDSSSEEPNIIFGNLDEATTTPPPSSNSTDSTEKETHGDKESKGQRVDEVKKPTEKAAETTSTVQPQKTTAPPPVDASASLSTPAGAQQQQQSSITEDSQEKEKENEKEAASGWKRNVAMVEKTAAQMLLRSDGITRYGKSQLCTLNSWGKVCPTEIKEMYTELANIERPPMCETTRVKSPNNNNRQNNNSNNNNNRHHKNKNQLSDEPHPDEMKIFSSEHLKSDSLFGGGRPDKVVDTTSNDGIISQANFILNVMTIETFDKMSDKFMKVGLDSEDLMKVGVDLIVSKAQLEEHFSFMYADLCKKITDQWVTTDGGEGELGKQFRGLLLNRCQEEFEQDREAAQQAILDLKLDQDDEDEKLLILKKRYTGHMRFVGEIYMKDMLKANKMHYCVTELLESKDESGKPDAEKLACLCKLFQTIGKRLEDYDIKKKRNKVQEYFDKIAIMSDDKSLSSKVRFGFKDLIEMRLNNWTARRVEEKAKKLSEIRKEDGQSNHSTPRSSSSTPRSGGTGFGGGSSSSSGGRVGHQDVRKAPISESAAADEWTTVATSTKGKKGKGGSNTFSSGSFSSSSSSPSSFSGQSNMNKFSALNVNTKNSSGRSSSNKNSPMAAASTVKKTTPGMVKGVTSDLKIETSSSPTASATENSKELLPGHDGEVDANTVKRIIAAHNEYYGNDLIDELVEVLKELIHENGMWSAVHFTMKSVMGLNAAYREKYYTLLPKLYERKVLTREQTVKGISFFLNEFDDFVMDVPLLADYFSKILANLFVHGVFEGDVRFLTTLPDENEFSISYRAMSVVVQTAMVVKSMSSDEKAIEFFKSAMDVLTIDSMQKEQLDSAIEKYGGQLLTA